MPRMLSVDRPLDPGIFPGSMMPSDGGSRDAGTVIEIPPPFLPPPSLGLAGLGLADEDDPWASLIAEAGDFALDDVGFDLGAPPQEEAQGPQADSLLGSADPLLQSRDASEDKSPGTVTVPGSGTGNSGGVAGGSMLLAEHVRKCIEEDSVHGTASPENWMGGGLPVDVADPGVLLKPHLYPSSSSKGSNSLGTHDASPALQELVAGTMLHQSGAASVKAGPQTQGQAPAFLVNEAGGAREEEWSIAELKGVLGLDSMDDAEPTPAGANAELKAVSGSDCSGGAAEPDPASPVLHLVPAGSMQAGARMHAGGQLAGSKRSSADSAASLGGSACDEGAAAVETMGHGERSGQEPQRGSSDDLSAAADVSGSSDAISSGHASSSGRTWSPPSMSACTSNEGAVSDHDTPKARTAENKEQQRGQEPWHSAAAHLLQSKGMPNAADHRVGCLCGRCSLGLSSQVELSPASSPQQAGSDSENQERSPVLLSVDSSRRPADLSDRLAAVIDRLSGQSGSTAEGQVLAALSSDKENNALALPTSSGYKRSVSPALPAHELSYELKARGQDPGRGKGRGLKRDARKKGRFTAEGSVQVPAPSFDHGSSLLKTNGVPASFAALSAQLEAGYFRTCDVDVTWRVTPGALPAPTLPLLPGPSEDQDVRSPRAWNGLSPSEFASMHFNPGAGPFASGQALHLPSLSPSATSVPSMAGPGRQMLLTESEGDRAGDPAQGQSPIREMLLALAESYATDDVAKVRNLSRRLAKKADKVGKADQRLAYYFLTALEARAEGTGSQKFLEPITVPADDLNGAMRQLCRVVPFLQTCQMVQHEAILDAAAGEDSVHILALGLWHGDNWQELFKRFAERPGGPPRLLRVTGVDAPVTPGKLAIKLSSANVVLQVKAAAASAGLHVDVEFLPTPMEKLRASAVRRMPGEVLVAFCSMRLQLLPDASVVRSNPRDSLIHAIAEMKPRVFVMSESNANFNSPFFLARVREALGYYGEMFESIDMVSDWNCSKRQVFEEAYFARDILNVVACEGLHRMVRSERREQWAERFQRLGFVPRPLPPGLEHRLQSLYTFRAKDARKSGFSLAPDHEFRVAEKSGGLEIGWRGSRMMFAAAWTTQTA